MTIERAGAVALIKRAEGILKSSSWTSAEIKLVRDKTLPELIAELKAARAENERLHEQLADAETFIHYTTETT